MKTNIIRCATLLVVLALSLNASAQKNVLKAFEKFKNSNGVTVTNMVREQGKTKTSSPWRCNIVEFKVFGGAGYVSKIKELQDAFEQDSQDADVTYYGQMNGLPENASEEAKAKYKKTIVRYNDEDAPIVIGENTTYNVLMIRSNSKEHPQNRIVVAMEWKTNEKPGWIGHLYEIEGPSNLVRAATETAAGENVEVDDFITRMYFYRDNYTKGSDDDRALLMSMLTYLTAHAPMASENEKAVARSILGEMGQDNGEVSPTMVMNQNFILQCLQVLEPKQEFMAIDRLVMERLDSYYQEWRRETILHQQQQVLNRMAEYIRAQQAKGMSEATFNQVVASLGEWKSHCTIIAQKDFISGLLTTMERKQNGME
ncbi:MAG: hypothetical protein J5616_02305 [Bacteroidaceae bacterium]|nr:hypothetical protein [Bacteroidaceae bacterium]